MSHVIWLKSHYALQCIVCALLNSDYFSWWVFNFSSYTFSNASNLISLTGKLAPALKWEIQFNSLIVITFWGWSKVHLQDKKTKKIHHDNRPIHQDDMLFLSIRPMRQVAPSSYLSYLRGLNQLQFFSDQSTPLPNTEIILYKFFTLFITMRVFGKAIMFSVTSVSVCLGVCMYWCVYLGHRFWTTWVRNFNLSIGIHL